MNATTPHETTYPASPGSLVAMGIGEVILGVLTVIFAVFTTWLTVTLLGIVLAVRGVIECVQALRSHGTSFWWRLAGGILGIVVGLFFISRPVAAAESLTFLLAIFFISIGLFRTIAAPAFQTRNRGFLILSGIIAIIAGALILAGMPMTAFWFIGVLVGSEIIFDGLTMITLGMLESGEARRSAMPHQAAEPARAGKS